VHWSIDERSLQPQARSEVPWQEAPLLGHYVIPYLKVTHHSEQVRIPNKIV
jgi:hypothetical protein